MIFICKFIPSIPSQVLLLLFLLYFLLPHYSLTSPTDAYRLFPHYFLILDSYEGMLSDYSSK